MATTLDLREYALKPGQGTHEELDLEIEPYRQGGFSYRAPGDRVPARVDLNAMQDGWAMRLRADVDLTGPCSRCLEPATIHFEVDAREVHDPRAGTDELASPFVGHEGILDVTHWALDAIGTDFPHKVLCRDDCKGLCPSCGTNWNDGPCDCAVDDGDPRWDALRALLAENDQNP